MQTDKRGIGFESGINRFKSRVRQLLAVGTQIRCSTFLNVKWPVCKMRMVRGGEKGRGNNGRGGLGCGPAASILHGPSLCPPVVLSFYSPK